MSDTSNQQYIALVRTEFSNGTLNALPGQVCRTDHLSKGKIGLLVKRGAIMPKAEWDALSEEAKTQRTGLAFEAVFGSGEIVINNAREGE